MSTEVVIKINPEVDAGFISLYSEVQRLLDYATVLTVTSNEDVKRVTNDLSLISKLRKSIEEKRTEYTGPINEHLHIINAAFKTITEPLESAWKITRGKVTAYNLEQERRRREAEEINRQKDELAKREAKLNEGVITVNTEPVVVPAAPQAHIYAEAGTLGTRKDRKWEVEDITKVPVEYLTVDSVAIGKLVRAGIKSIAGIRIWTEDSLTVRPK